MSTTPDLDALVPEWLPLPDLADRIGVPFTQVRNLVRDRYVVGVRRGERAVFQVPAAFLVPAEGGAGEQVLPSLRGTVLVLADQGLPDEEIVEWLFAANDALGTSPVEALRAGRKTEVRRVAQAVA
ncbi:Rv2175c family DNA-binding protein [Puerhibacterium puerhi]|uniref:Rv2175c family DNA-binding protein n=1 Tax=Puerhibacterium puerhi TaxID=2692623 RepID=UPI001357B935|nr:Rv2175c family DNA-binding protein [Puerhibacterium puerhi]